MTNETSQRLNVWLADPLSFTPWYSASLALALKAKNANLRFISASISREASYLQAVGLDPEPGPFRFDAAFDSAPKSIRRVLRSVAALLNSSALRLSLSTSHRSLPDVIHLQQLPLLNHGLGSDFRLIRVAQRKGIPVIHTVHNLLPHDTGRTLHKIYKKLYQSVDHLICHSNDVATKLNNSFGISPETISVIPHGPLFEPDPANPLSTQDTRIRLGLPAGRMIVLWQGVMAPYKGLETLLRAWELCIARWKESPAQRPLLLIAGSGSEELERQVQEATHSWPGDIYSVLHYIPTRELPLYYSASDVFVYPYKDITTSGALLTGLSYNKPIIASDLEPFKPFLRHNENALLVEPGSVTGLSEAFVQLLQCKPLVNTSAESRSETNLYLKLLLAAQSNHTLYTGWDEIAAKTVAVYKKLLARRSAVPSAESVQSAAQFS